MYRVTEECCEQLLRFRTGVHEEDLCILVAAGISSIASRVELVYTGMTSAVYTRIG
jgi:hypothetical protein